MWSSTCAVAEPVPEACVRQQVRRVRHRLHAARDDHVVLAGADHQVGDLDRADRGRADLVDRVGGHLLRDARADRGLPRGRLPGAGLQHLAHDDVARPRPGRSRRARGRRGSTIAPSCGAECLTRPPPSLPKGVRTVETITERVMRPA